jgi:signal transduction histidine kinase
VGASDPCGAVAGMVASVGDVTHRKEVERLEDEFVSTVSHELRTPLSSLRGFAELMLAREFPAAKQRELPAIIHSEALRLTTPVDDFSDLQRMKSGRQPYAFASVDLAELLRASLSRFQPHAESHHFSLELADSLPAVWADPGSVQRVLTNPISNAIKFSSSGSTVTVGARREAEQVAVWVADQGIGVAADALPKLFSRFYRVDSEA